MEHPFNYLHWRKEIPIRKYLEPHSISEALEMLLEYDGKAKIIAGGTDVIPQIRRGELDTEILVDITHLPNMKSIEESEGRIVLGALVTHSSIASSSLLRDKAKLLVEGARCLGSPQIRNIATVAGNLVSGQPAADSSIPLLALDASVTIASKGGERVAPLKKFFVDTGRTIIDCRREILTRIEFNVLEEHHGCCYLRLSKRKALTLPILVCGVLIKVDRERRIIKEAAIALGPVSPIPYRAKATEASLSGAHICKETIDIAAQIASNEANPRPSLLRGSGEYRKEMVKVLTRRALVQAMVDAGISNIEGI